MTKWMSHVIPHLSFHTCHSEMGYLDGHSRNLFRSLDCPSGPSQDYMNDCLTTFVRRGSFHYPDVASLDCRMTRMITRLDHCEKSCQSL